MKAFRGDDHVGPSGSFRVQQELDWTSTQDSNQELQDTGLVSHGRFGATHLDELWTYGGKTRSCPLEAKTATGKTSGSLDNLVIKLGVATKNPITPQLITPAIKADVAASVLCYASDRRGTRSQLGCRAFGLEVSYMTDLFPSYALTVETNNGHVGTWVINDASCVQPVFGLTGATEIGLGLSRATNEGYITITDHRVANYDSGDHNWQREDLPDGARAPSGLCKARNMSVFLGAKRL